MALVRCPDCENEISDVAPSCPQCGRPRNIPTPKPQKARSSNIGIGCLLLIAILIFLAYLGKPSPEQEAKENAEGTPGMAAIMCQDFVKRRLKAPSSAKFPNAFGEDTKTVTLSAGHYLVTSYVDAQNSFGAQIRTSFVCEIKKIPGGNEWQLQNLSM